MANFDGTAVHCLTCSGPQSQNSNVNGVPAVRPQGDWILFHSWRGHYFTIGSPGYGGLGSDLWVMRPDGSHQTQITDVQPPSAGPGNGDGYDDYHAYWSPDGKHLVYAHLNWNFVTGGGQGKWDVRVADFVDDASGPHLTNVRVVRPANGHWYETQWWAPDGSGFLYTETYGAAVIPQLFFCRLTATGCQVTRLSDSAAWDEQALFTPDGKDVIFMSSRDRPGVFNSWATVAQDLGLTNDEDYLLILPLFEAGFLQPVGQETTDLYDLHLATGSVRRLSTDGNDGWITPEFTWDPTGKFMMWTENRFRDGLQYQFPPDQTRYLQQLADLVSNPPVPGVDATPNGVGVAPIQVDQRTRIGVFDLGPGAPTRSVTRHGSSPGPARQPRRVRHRRRAHPRQVHRPTSRTRRARR
jgi:Tol biopolymer transport system component